jgi:hypothetical protein
MDLLIHLLILCLVIGIVYWLITLVVSVLPPPIANAARVVLLCILGLMAIGVLLGETGLYGSPLGWHHRW